MQDDLTLDALEAALREGEDYLPLIYRSTYLGPLKAHLGHLLRAHDDRRRVTLNVETLVGAVNQHGPASPVRGQLRQFLAVVSNYYRSFLSPEKRAALEIPQAEDAGLPPLATFRYEGDQGPFVLPIDMTRKLVGAEVAVVSLPERLMDHPVCWLTLAHETAGHDVLHSDPSLLPELVAGVRSMFGGGPLEPGARPDDDQIQALLWSYWIDEVAADVYAVLNGGPAFAYNLLAFLRGLRAQVPGLGIRLERTDRWTPLDTHPTAALRLHVAVGVVETLAHLAPEDRRRHVAALRRLAALESPPRLVPIRGRIEVERDRWADVDQRVPFTALAQAGRRVGAFIATTRLAAFGGKSVQEVETWDADDERITRVIADHFLAIGRDREKERRIKILGDDAQLLAGATLALLEEPGLYDNVNSALAEALEESHRRDPVLGLADVHPLLDLPEAAPPDVTPESDPRTASAGPGVGGPPEATPQAPSAGPPGGASDLAPAP